MIRICEIDIMFIKCSQTYIGIRKHEIGSGTKLLFTFLSLTVFRLEERETIFLCWLLLHRQFSTQPTCGVCSAQIRLASPSSECRLSCSEAGTQLPDFFSNPQILSPCFRCVTSLTSPGLNSSLRFLFWHLQITHPLRARVNTCVMFAPN